jgi:hypothetical protein
MLIYLTFALLTVARIAGAGYTVFVIFIPLFIVVRGSRGNVGQCRSRAHAHLVFWDDD